jgi:hypothetical protein
MTVNNLPNDISSNNDGMTINSETAKPIVSSMPVVNSGNYINNDYKMFFINLINNLEKRLIVVEISISGLKNSILELKNSTWKIAGLLIAGITILFSMLIFFTQQNNAIMTEISDNKIRAMEKRLDDRTQAMEKKLDDAVKFIDDKLEIILKNNEITRQLALEAMKNASILSDRDLYSQNKDKE